MFVQKTLSTSSVVSPKREAVSPRTQSPQSPNPVSNPTAFQKHSGTGSKVDTNRDRQALSKSITESHPGQLGQQSQHLNNLNHQA